jgi:NAD(P)-dependent dehydrogenase (short-subunit alcohol dehydrogenase family)
LADVAASAQSLSGRVSLITGAGGDIGAAICEALHRAGAQVIATDIADGRRPNSDAAPYARWLRHDVTSAGDWMGVVNEVSRDFGRLDCLINNAAIALVETVADTSFHQWRRVMSVNVDSVFLGMRASMALLRQSGQDRKGGSSIVNVSSTAGLRGAVFNSAYCASKGAMTLLTKAAAKEFATLKYPIRVNSIHPSGVETRLLDGIFARYVQLGAWPSVGAGRREAIAAIPMGRLAEPTEVADAIVFLCSESASYITGAEFVLDGGTTC